MKNDLSDGCLLHRVLNLICFDMNVFTYLVLYNVFLVIEFRLYNFIYFNFDVYTLVLVTISVYSDIIYLFRFDIGSCLNCIYVQIINLFTNHLFSKFYLQNILIYI